MPFNATNYAHYQPMIDVIAACGPGFKALSFHDIRGSFLQNEVQRINEYLIEFKESWAKTRCTIMIDVKWKKIEKEVIGIRECIARWWYDADIPFNALILHIINL